MKKYYVIIIAVLILVGSASFYYFVYPVFNKIKINDPLPGEKPTENENEGAPNMSGDENKPTSANTKKEPAPMSERKFPVVDTLAHPASGFVRIISDISGIFIRYENYETINGPDLYVYLSKDLEAKEFVDLGPIKGTSGNINYQLPEGVNITDYKYVLTWCRAFGVLFNYAEINQ